MEVSMSALIASAGISSGPGALPVFRRLIAFLISSLSGLSQLTSKTSDANGMSGGLLGAGLSNSSSKWSLHLPIWSSSLVRITPFLYFICLSACLNFPASFIVVSYSCFMFPRAAASSASFVRLSIKFTLFVFTLFFTAVFATVYCSWAAAIVDRVLLLFRTAFFYFLPCNLLIVSTEIKSLCCVFFFPITSSHVLVRVFFIHSQCGFTSMVSSSRRSCNASYCLSGIPHYILFYSSAFQLLSFNFSFVSTRWWSEAASAPLSTLTYCIDILLVWLMQIWSIWFSVRWSGDTHVALWILLCGNTLPPIINLVNGQRSANISPFSFISPIPCVPMTSSYPLLFDPIFALKSPMGMVTSFSFTLSRVVCSLFYKSLFLHLYHLLEHSTVYCLVVFSPSWFWKRHASCFVRMPPSRSVDYMPGATA